jgi:hypothetical protein
VWSGAIRDAPAWTELKELDVPKDYVSWVKARANRKATNS